MKVYGDTNSGNCLKVKWVCDHLALPYTWVAVDTLKGETRTAEFLKLNGAGQVPAVELDDGRTLAQSNAIIRYLARGSRLIPQDAFAGAGQTVLRQQADDFKKRGAHIIVKILGRKFLLPRFLKPCPHVFRKLADEVGSGVGNGGLWHFESPAAGFRR